jgi:hypothetical protein
MFTFIFCSSGPPARELSVIAARASLELKKYKQVCSESFGILLLSGDKCQIACSLEIISQISQIS